jgi:hypothetical protein
MLRNKFSVENSNVCFLRELRCSLESMLVHAQKLWKGSKRIVNSTYSFVGSMVVLCDLS